MGNYRTGATKISSFGITKLSSLFRAATRATRTTRPELEERLATTTRLIKRHKPLWIL